MKTRPDSAPADILVVDDTPANLQLLSGMLKEWGYKFRLAVNGEVALQSARHSPPDLILLDITMPGLSGYDVAGQLKADAQLKNVPIIFLSALTDAEDKVRAFALGGVDYVTKPFQFAEVEARISTHLRIRRLQVELEQRNAEYRQANDELRRLEELRDSLATAANFGLCWTYYQQFDGQLLVAECRKSALDFLYVLDQHIERDPKVKAAFSNPAMGKVAANLRTWANDSGKSPPPQDFLGLTDVLLLLAHFRRQIEGQFKTFSTNTEQIMHPDVARRLESYLKWRGHFPRLETMPDLRDVMEKASRSSTIVVIGDIRRSQDLMTYAMSEVDFSRRMVEFVRETRAKLDQYGGFFDKFTGDGFIGYFNEAICQHFGSDYIESFVGFIGEFTDFCDVHFGEWLKFVRKTPSQAVGLAIGADIGLVSFQSLNYHVVAVSESIVWASRMASAAGAQEIFVNNLLYQALRQRHDLAFESRDASTKSGESFRAWRMEVKGQGKKQHALPV